MDRRLGTLAAACSVWLSLAGCRCGRPEPVRGPPPTAVADRPAVLATLPADAEREYLFAERGGGVAWVEQEGGRFQVVHDGRPGKAFAAVGTIVLSPDGRRCAHGALVDGTWRLVVDGAEGPGFAEIQAPAFSPDGAHVAYLARAGERWHPVIDGTLGPGARSPPPELRFSGDSSRLAFIADPDQQGVGRLLVSDLDFQEQVVVEARASELVSSADGRWLAAVGEREGKATVLKLAFAAPGRVHRGPGYDAASSPALGPDGASVAYLAERAGRRLVVLDDLEEPLPPGEVFGPPVIRPGKKALGVAILEGGLVRLLQPFAAGEAAGPAVDELEALVYSSDGRSHAYVARRGERWFVVVNGKEGPPLDRVVSPAFSPDGRFLVYRARQDGRRFVVVADLGGRTVRQHPPYQQVFPVRFTADGRSVAYGVKDGLRLAWKVEPL